MAGNLDAQFTNHLIKLLRFFKKKNLGGQLTRYGSVNYRFQISEKLVNFDDLSIFSLGQTASASEPGLTRLAVEMGTERSTI